MVGLGLLLPYTSASSGTVRPAMYHQCERQIRRNSRIGRSGSQGGKVAMLGKIVHIRNRFERLGSLCTTRQELLSSAVTYVLLPINVL